MTEDTTRLAVSAFVTAGLHRTYLTAQELAACVVWSPSQGCYLPSWCWN